MKIAAFRRAGGLAVAGAVTAGIFAACSGSGTATFAAERIGLPRGAGAYGSSTWPITVVEDEYALRLDVRTLHPGTYTFTVRNAGAMAHDINVTGPNIDDATTGYIDPGGSSSMTLRLAPGTYRVYCSVTGHEALGMHTTITVRA